MNRRPEREAVALVHPTYRHLDRPVRVAGLALGQWAALIAAGLGAYALARLLPLPPATALSVAVTVCGMPVAAQLAAGERGPRVFSEIAALLRGGGSARRYPPGASRACAVGYRIDADGAPSEP